MSKINIELSEKEAKKYFAQKHSFNFSNFLKNLDKKKVFMIALIIFATVAVLIGFVCLFNTINEESYQQGKIDAINSLNEQKAHDILFALPLSAVWSWFAKECLFFLGNHIHQLFLVACVVWLIHGGLFKIA